jgi:hypothetical protein
MQQFIQSLEQRTFFSTALLADQTTILADENALKLANKSLATQIKVSLAAITVDLKTLPKTNAPLLKTVKADDAALSRATTSDQNAIVTPSTRLAKTAVTAGTKLLTSWTAKAAATVATDATNLNSILVAPLGKLGLDLTGPLVTDLGVILGDNPTAAQLAADISTLDTAYAADAAALTSKASQLQLDLGSLSTDLIADTAVPNVQFNYSGSIKETVGPKKGHSLRFTFDITIEAADGSWTASYASINGAGIAVSQPSQGTVSDTGVFNGELSDGTVMTGTVSGKTIRGTAVSGLLQGTFVVSHP